MGGGGAPHLPVKGNSEHMYFAKHASTGFLANSRLKKQKSLSELNGFKRSGILLGQWLNGFKRLGMTNTLPKTNIAPENRPLEKEIPIGNHHFQGLR